MKMTINPRRAIHALAVLAMLFTACQKENAGNETDAESTTIAVAATAAATGTASSADSVYLVQACRQGDKREGLTEAQLPAAIRTYVGDAYDGAIFHKAFVIKNRSAAIAGYVVVVYYNDKPVGLLFSADGSFVRVLEQREKRDLSGPGHHRGGRFEHRDGQQRDTVALASLPAGITAYFAANFATDVLVKAYRGKDNSLVVVSKNDTGLYATVFSASNGFIRRVQFPSRPGHHVSIALAQLPSAAANYLAQTYPNYVFQKAFQVTLNGVVEGYVVLIDANNTKYAVAFDKNGAFLRAKVIR